MRHKKCGAFGRMVLMTVFSDRPRQTHSDMTLASNVAVNLLHSQLRRWRYSRQAICSESEPTIPGCGCSAKLDARDIVLPKWMRNELAIVDKYDMIPSYQLPRIMIGSQLGWSDVPLLISSTGVTLNILLDLLIISKFHLGSWTRTPTVNDQALIRLACDMTLAIFGPAYFLTSPKRCIDVTKPPRVRSNLASKRSTFWHAHQLPRLQNQPSGMLFIYGSLAKSSLWVKTKRRHGPFFKSIRWGLIMVPVQAPEASTLAFMGHRWGRWRALIGSNSQRPKVWRHDSTGFDSSNLGCLH